MVVIPVRNIYPEGQSFDYCYCHECGRFSAKLCFIGREIAASLPRNPSSMPHSELRPCPSRGDVSSREDPFRRLQQDTSVSRYRLRLSIGETEIPGQR